MPTKVLVLSDDGLSSGFGRISMEINKRLHKRGYHIHAASIQYDGLLPPQLDGEQLPYWVSALGGKPNWPEILVNIANAVQPHIIVTIQDAPYGVTTRDLPLDWSQLGFIMVTPVDGEPIFPQWVDTMKRADAALTISRFGVEAYRKAGVSVNLCQPGVDLNTFYRLNDDERAAIRARLGIPADAFVFGMFAQHQGRKDVPDTLRVFYEFAKDKPNARLWLDMEAVSPVGWHIPYLCQQQGWDISKIIFRPDALRMGVVNIRERMNVLDVHAVLAHREGWGLPLVESMACGVPTMALDWCSGSEIVGEGRGLLVKPIAYSSVSTWGGALDCYPDISHAVSLLQRMYENPAERATIAQTGMTWARQQTWDAAADSLQAAIERVLAKRSQAKAQTPPPIVIPSIQMTPQPDGVVNPVELMEMKAE